MRYKRPRHYENRIAKFIDNLYITNPEKFKGNWKDLLKTDKLCLEIGMGKGSFINKIASLYPKIGFIGMERLDTLILPACEISESEEITNTRYIAYNAYFLLDIFSGRELDGIYLNFSDPWLKHRHVKRRLTYPDMLEKYAYVLKKGGFLEFKTDNDVLFEFSKVSIQNSTFKIDEINEDLHKNGENMEILTEYESKFVNLGISIKYIRAINQL